MAEPAPQPIQAERSQEQTSGNAYLWLTRGIAVLLLFAAGMKAWQLATVPSLGEGLLHARWFNIVVVEFEIVFACWLLMGLLPKLTRWATIALFTTFAGVSLYKAVSGEASCGCFGAVTVNPWWTMGLGVVVVGLVVLHRHNQRVSCPWFDLAELDKRRLAWTVVVWLVMSIPTTFAMTSVKTNDLSELGTVFMGADGKETILLEPEKWKKGVFPLLPYIEPPEVREQLKTGTWTVVLYHHDCPKCQKVIEELAAKGEPNVVCVEVPPSIAKRTCFARLNEQVNWFVTTPNIIKLEN
ncbi:MAG: DoxX family protein [Planctomycetia bacterium]|nr:DoxX family protein [Planctomycetia bacterium]